MAKKLLRAAVWYQKKGFSVIPVCPNKKPFIKWEKHQVDKLLVIMECESGKEFLK